MSKTNKTHSIRTIGDISKIITTDNYEILLSDIAETFLRVLQYKQAIKEETGEYPKISIMDDIAWTDDGVQGLSELIINGERFTITPMKDQMKDLDDDE